MYTSSLVRFRGKFRKFHHCFELGKARNAGPVGDNRRTNAAQRDTEVLAVFRGRLEYACRRMEIWVRSMLDSWDRDEISQRDSRRAFRVRSCRDKNGRSSFVP